MFFNKATQQAFVFPPKTGTIATRHFLGAIGWAGLPAYHATPNELIEKYPSLNSYTIYGFFRDPVKRFESAILNVKQFPATRKTLTDLLVEKDITDSVELITYENLIDIYGDLTNKFNKVFLPQVNWLDHAKVTVLDYQNVETELRRITGNNTQEFKRWNVSSDFGRSVITQKVIDFVRQEYAADYALAKERFSKDF